MRSDREEIPEGYTKEQADEAEMVEARLQQRARTSRAAPGCQAYWPVGFEVCGAIRDKYNSLGAQWGFLSFPTSGEQTSPDGHGKFTTFVNGPIYWSAAGGAHPVLNSFLNRWGVHGYEMGWLGYPTTDEIVHADGVGRRQEFQNGAIYVAFQNAIGSAIKNGPIRDKWNGVGAETPGSVLGYLTGDEIPLPDGQGRMARFQRGVVYWHPSTGAHPVTGAILNQWSRAGYEQSSFGYPTGDAIAQPASTVEQQFQNGRIYDSGIYIPIAANVSLSFGIPAATALQPVVLPNGVTLNGPGFSTSLQKVAADGTYELTFRRDNAQAPSSFKTVFGLPAGYTVQANGTRINVLSPTGSLVAGIGIPLGFDANGQLVSTQANVSGNELSLQFNGTGAYPINSYAIATKATFIDEWWSTGVQQKQVCESNPYDCARVRNARGPAYDKSVEAFPDTHNLIPPPPGETEWLPATEDNRVDAARHCMWNGLMTEGANADFAEQMNAAHERDGRASPHWDLKGEKMDVYNNKTGVHVGLRNEGDVDNLMATCVQYARDARIVPDPSTIDLSNPNANDLIALRHPQ
ncbi:LGFP repeat-containing protein [Rhodococcus erythropolis]|uniref:LGFP repeat-containing protein n=1 Tax=Rhodococcus erythropolis TaxID=1833 RepID=UPI0011131016|nr:LGFP repeat-containing protein [Rhodococcus erythropolis]MBT1258277.1 LGFP repeat-containing protein [Rhodococcus erythropolis]